MPDIVRTITTATDARRVWEYLSDFTTAVEWDPPTQSAVRENGDGGVGTVYRNVSSVLGREIEIEYTVIEHEAPHRLRLRGSTSSMTVLDTITVEPDGDGATVLFHAEFCPQGDAEPVLPLAPLLLKNLGDDAAECMVERLSYL